MKQSKTVLVTDFGAVVVPDKVVRRYAEHYFSRRAPKKSAKVAMQRLTEDGMAMMNYAWIMGRTEPKW